MEVDVLNHTINSNTATPFDPELRYRRLGYWFIAALFATVFLSKVAIDSFLFFALLTAIYYLIRFKPWHRLHNPVARDFAIPLMLGLLLGFLSLAGWMGPVLFLEKFRSMLVLLPLILFVRSREDFVKLLMLASISAIIGIAYAYFSGQPFGAFRGLHRIGRQADMLMLLALALTPWFFQGPFQSDKRWVGNKAAIAGVLILLLVALALTSIRGSWLAFALGALCFALFFNRWLLILLIGALLLVGTLDVSEKYRKEVASIGDLQNNVSNNTRIHLWRAGIDFFQQQPFFGTGSNNSQQYYIPFFNNMPKAYQEKYHLAINHTRDWHNSYLQILVQNGLFVLMAFLYMLTALFIRLIRRLRHVDQRDRPALIAAILAMIGFGVSQFFHSELFSYGAVLFYLLVYGGLRVCLQADEQNVNAPVQQATTST